MPKRLSNISFIHMRRETSEKCPVRHEVPVSENDVLSMSLDSNKSIAPRVTAKSHEPQVVVKQVSGDSSIVCGLSELARMSTIKKTEIS